ncbi:MAG: protoheme IX farnesyltransferase [Bacteroidetes bacterium]|jgi:heme o synthase|nr:protoheme IX farnesyltransferase [Bacteroidota bacterium]MBT5531145.1 protoheme IX farnesyltransferase [Cytophagia bacterium]MBT3422340.1 protoheme IX farnesyltransferase [Bacteroidota bacterium]MBT3801318.1 protoheme IX farnesyltransferase [Bacteroidota bacterium]MBT3934413.1 protoheme IX farnesyltransferase [Bacteroidota bacterium]
MFKQYLELAKVRITIAVTLTTIVGYVLANGGFSWHLVFPTLGIFLIACGSAALNQFQERKLDATMERTKNRPIPSGQISEFNAQLFILLLTVTGSLMILLSSNLTALVLALLAMAWYNLIYTPLKRKTAFAVVPGSVIGALPPMVGWVAAGGYVFDPKLLILAFFFFIWQIPHFWLLLMKYGKQYEKAGFPSLTKIYSEKQLKRITFMWTVATALSCLFIPFFEVTYTSFAKISILIFSLLLIAVFSGLLFRSKQTFQIFRYFMVINVFLLLVILSLAIDSMLI